MKLYVKSAKFLVVVVLSLSTANFAWSAVPASGEVRLKTKVVARYEYHFNRNSIRDSVLVSDALIALTNSRNLVRFDLKTLQPTHEYFEAEWISCIGGDERDTALVGLEDGRICRVDSKTLKLTELAMLPGEPTWLGVSQGQGPARSRIVAVVEDKTIHDLSTGKVIELKNPAYAFFLDSKRGLWIGGGNSCSRLDLATGILRPIEGLMDRKYSKASIWEPIHGFIELEDGRVLVYGGSDGFGPLSSKSAFVRRVDGPQAERLYFSDGFDRISANNTRPNDKAMLEIANPQQAITSRHEIKKWCIHCVC